MKFRETSVHDAYVIEMEPAVDRRGSFGRFFDRRAFLERGLTADVEQCSSSYNEQRGTLRGLHRQVAPHEEAKLVRCTNGRIFDVVADTREESSTKGCWFGLELTPISGLALYVPEGCVHGFLTRENHSVVDYLISAKYEPSASAGVRWNDPALGIEWPEEPVVLSDRDAKLPGADM